MAASAAPEATKCARMAASAAPEATKCARMAAVRLVRDRPVSDLQGRVQDLEPLVQLGFGDAQRRGGPDRRPAPGPVQPRVPQPPPPPPHLRPPAPRTG